MKITEKINNWYYVYLGIIIFLELVMVFLINASIVFVERKKFSKKILGLIFLPLLGIPLYTAALTKDFGLLDWAHWLKTGNIIFSVILYECSYIAYVKTKM